MEQINRYDYDEISLRELIETLLKGWKLIAIITIICVLASGVFSFFIIDPTYEANTTLMASSATNKLSNVQNDSGDIEGILDSISSYPVMTIETYKQQVTNPDILQKTIDELKLDKEIYTVAGLKNMITLETIKDTNLIAIKVKNTDPKLATDIANCVAKNFTTFISNMAKDKASKSSQFIKTQLEVEKSKLDEALVELKQFLSQPRGVNELKAEINSKLSELNNYKDRISKEEVNFQDRLLNKEMQERELKVSLDEAKKAIETTPEKLITKKSLLEDNILNDYASENNDLEVKDLSQIEMSNEEINPNYILLDEKITNYEIQLARIKQEKKDIEYSYNKTIEILNNKINDVKHQLETLQVEFAEKEHEQKLIQRKVNLSQSTYDSFLNKYEQTRIAESSEIGDSSILIVSKAIVPQTPVSPRKMLNIAIAAVLGMMIGVFIAFFKEYWKNSAEDTKEKIV